ncbi:MAG: hypothetical protein QOG83_1887, partial [Alphaproteobacteria bacterium]|nr:hypothetical protein [Alphaproteobacteria bacterium]
GELQFSQGSAEEGFTSYRASLATAERVAGANPDNAQWQINLAVSHVNLAIRGDDTANRLQAVADILRKLRASFKLAPAQEKLVAALEGLLVLLAPK